MGVFSCELPIFVWVLINADVDVVIKMGAWCLLCVGAYYPDFTVWEIYVTINCMTEVVLLQTHTLWTKTGYTHTLVSTTSNKFTSQTTSLANFNDTISTISTTQRFIYVHQLLFSSRQEPIASQLTLFEDSMVKIKSTRRALGFSLPAEYAVMYTCYQRGVAVLECSQFFAFIIKHILGIKRIFPRSFGNKCKFTSTQISSQAKPQTTVWDQRVHLEH